nr:MAG TPA_asm: portal protein [Caudoviricetes sp.]
MKKRKKLNPARARHPTAAQSPRVTNSGYSEGGASRTRTALRGYDPIKSSTKADIDVNLPLLRSRSADIFINSPIGAGAINSSRANVIGAGLRVSPKPDYKVLGLSAIAAKEWQRNTQREFNLWAAGTSCDLYRKNSFYDMQDIAYLSYLVDGDAWAALKYRKPLPDNPYCLRIQLFEASRVCNPDIITAYGPMSYFEVEQRNPKNGNRIISGVEINNDGAVVAYWIANRVPFDLTNPANTLTWQRVEAFGRRTGRPNVLQISHEERPEQYRGVPYLAPAIEVIKQVSRYATAELTAALVKSCFALFFTSGLGTTNNNIEDILGSTYEERPKLTAQDMVDYDIRFGSMNLLPEGIDVKAIDGGRNLSTFEPFINALVCQIGASLGIPSEVLLSRFQSSYSAARGALLQAAAVFKTRRTWFARDFCQPIYEAWLAEAIAIGRIKAPGYGTDPLITAAWSGADWFGPVMGMLDPVKEVNGAALRVKYGFSTGEREAAELTGTDYDNNIDQIATEHSTWKAKGLQVPKVDKTDEGGEEKNE